MKAMRGFAVLLAVFLLSSCASAAASGTCGKDGDKLKWVLSGDGILTISGSGDMMDCSFNAPAPWNEHQDSIRQVVLSEGVRSVGKFAFWGSGMLSGVSLPKSLVSIGDEAFSHCSSLTEIALPDSVESIGEGVFSFSPKLESITVLQNPKFYTENGVLFSAADHCLICYPPALTAETYAIPEGTQAVADSAFVGCETLTEVTFPSSLASIGDAAFCGCSGLTALSLPDSVAAVGKWAFEDCSGLRTVSLPESLTSLGDFAFAYCQALTEATVPSGLDTLGNGTFYYCSALSAVKLPDGLRSIGDRAFHLCGKLSSISLPYGLESIGEYAFIGCGLSEIRLPPTVFSIGESAFARCEGLTAFVAPGSYAEQYCVDNQIDLRYVERPFEIGLTWETGAISCNILSPRDTDRCIDVCLLAMIEGKEEIIAEIDDLEPNSALIELYIKKEYLPFFEPGRNYEDARVVCTYSDNGELWCEKAAVLSVRSLGA